MKLLSKLFKTMKRQNLWVLFFLFFAQMASAQEFDGRLLLGSTFSQVDGDAFGGYNKLGLQTGLLVTRDINSNVLWGAGILYTQKGSRKKLDVDDPIRDIFILRFDYLETPIWIGYKAGKFQFTGGPSLGVLVNSKRDTGLGFQKIDDVKRLEWALKLGVTAELTEQLSVYLNHSQSVLRIGNPYQGGVYLFTWNGLYNRLFEFGIQYSPKG